MKSLSERLMQTEYLYNSMKSSVLSLDESLHYLHNEVIDLQKAARDTRKVLGSSWLLVVVLSFISSLSGALAVLWLLTWGKSLLP